MEAAKKVFYHNSYEDASINQVIKFAKIPRGSFYQYFEDKEDLYFYLINQTTEKFGIQIRNNLVKNKYDIFKTAQELFPRLLDEVFFGRDAEFFYRVMDALSSERLFHFRHSKHKKKYLSKYEIERIMQKYHFTDENDLQFLTRTVFMALIESVRECYKYYLQDKKIDLIKVKNSLQRRLDYLQNGFIR